MIYQAKILFVLGELTTDPKAQSIIQFETQLCQISSWIIDWEDFRSQQIDKRPQSLTKKSNLKLGPAEFLPELFIIHY